MNKNVQEKMKQIRRSQKVYGVPVLPQRIDAMYNNVCRGNHFAYYLDPDPIREDPVYKKLGELTARYNWESPSGSERVAEHFRHDMEARLMGERTYNHIRKMPLWLLKLEFAVKHEINRDIRKEIDARLKYMFRTEDKTWLDEN
jgi:hypothetical protein